MSNGGDKTADKVNAAGRVLVGRINAAQGLRGEVRITSFTANPEDIAAYGPLTNRAGGVVAIESLRVIKGTVLAARLAGVADRSGAEALKGVELYVERSRLPAADDDEWYYDDLVGLRADAEDGSEVGKVIAVHNHGAGDLLEIRLTDGGRTALVPFTETAVPNVNPQAGRLTVILPEFEDEPNRREDDSPN